MNTSSDLKELRFRKITDEIEGYAILLLDQEGNIETWNKGAEKIKGYAPAEIIGRNFRIFYSAEDQKRGLPEMLLAKAARDGNATHEGWRIKKNGEKFWGSVLITAIHDEKDTVIGYTKVTRDLTEKKQAEESLRRSEDRYYKMVAEIQDYAILLIDTEGNVENWNKGAERIKGYSEAEIIGKNFRLFYTPEDLAINKPEMLLEKASKEGRAIEEGFRVRKDGSRFFASVTITALHNEAGQITGFSKVTRDLTDRKKAEELQRHMQKTEARNDELEQLTYITSHDLQEPLRNIISFIEVLAEDYGTQLDENGRQTIQFISGAAHRMSQLIHGLLDYGRLGRNAKPKVLDCNEIMRGILDDFQTRIAQTNATVQVAELPVINGYETEFRLLLQNLVSNALKFRKPGIAPQISIWAEPHNQQNGSWRFAVKDNGIGIETRYLDRIFLIFQRLHSSNTFEGSGIGLAHCKRIAELHFGEIWVNSQPGKGSTFYFTTNTQGIL